LLSLLQSSLYAHAPIQGSHSLRSCFIPGYLYRTFGARDSERFILGN
jgi:hypothetical protein